MKRETKTRVWPAAILLIAIVALAAGGGLTASIESYRPVRPIEPTKKGPVKARPQKPVVVAVIDTGVDFSHPQLSAYRWRGAASWDFADAGPASLAGDRHGHGTHIAGIITGLGETALSPGAVQLLSLKYYDRSMSGEAALRNSILAIRYAIERHVDIINYSGGGTSPSDEERQALREAEQQGILVIAAAGNESSNADREPFYPAAYGLSNILSVTASGPDENLLHTSNFGRRNVALAAQGFRVRSTMPGGGFGEMTGTSQATAFVTRVAVRLLRQQRASPAVLIQRLLSSSQTQAELTGKTTFGSKLDEVRALRFLNQTTSTADELADRLKSRLQVPVGEAGRRAAGSEAR